MKKIKIFLASSLREFEREREQIENFIRNVSDNFEDKYNIKILPVLCENIDPAYTVERKQEEYNRIIRDCEMVFFIFFTKLGEFTYEEFLVAKKQFEEKGSPKIYTYFKVLEESQEMDEALSSFMQELDHALGHYHSTFEHLDTIKLRMLLSLKIQEMDFVEIKNENGQCFVDGTPVLKLENVAEFANNDTLMQLKSEYAIVEEEYFKVKAIHTNNKNDAAISKQYAELSMKRQKLHDEINDLQTNIFRISMNMCYDNVHGNITMRQKQAYRLFEMGDLEGCLHILDADEINDEYFSTEKVIEEMAISNARKFIREHMMAIDILNLMIDYPKRYAEILERYQKIIPVVKKYLIETEVFLKYFCCLVIHARYARAQEFIDELILFYKDHPEKFSKKELAELYMAKGDLYLEMTVPTEGYKAYKKALKVMEKNTDDQKTLTAIYCGISDSLLAFNKKYRDIYIKNNGSLSYKLDLPNHLIWMRTKKAIIKFLESVQKLYEKESSDENKWMLSKAYLHLARHYEHHNNKLSEENYKKALSIVDTCLDDNKNEEISKYYQSAFMFYWLTKPHEDAEKYLKKLIKIREDLFEINPDKSFHMLYTTYIIAQNYYLGEKNVEEADKYEKADIELASIFKKKMDELADVDPEEFMLLTDEKRMLNVWQFEDMLR